MMWGWDGTGWGWLWMTLMMAVVWLPLLFALVWFIRQVGGPRDRGVPPEPDAIEVARRAYARGDLDRERYLQIVEDLRSGASGRRP